MPLNSFFSLVFPKIILSLFLTTNEKINWFFRHIWILTYRFYQIVILSQVLVTNSWNCWDIKVSAYLYKIYWSIFSSSSFSSFILAKNVRLIIIFFRIAIEISSRFRVALTISCHRSESQWDFKSQTSHTAVLFQNFYRNLIGEKFNFFSFNQFYFFIQKYIFCF